MLSNVDSAVVRGFGQEWSTFKQDCLSKEERQRIFDDYFRIFPWHLIGKNSVGADIGCGTGRWAYLVSPRVKKLYLVDPSIDALTVAANNLGARNATYICADVSNIPISSMDLDFAYALGVLHHLPDTERAIKEIAAKLKPGAPFLIYLYYAFDNKPRWYRFIWKISNVFRLGISRLPHWLRLAITSTIASLVYWPLAHSGLPLLSYYRDKSFYTMRTDAYDRFSTRLEKRFTRAEIFGMLVRSGFKDIKFSNERPYWCAVGIKA